MNEWVLPFSNKTLFTNTDSGWSLLAPGFENGALVIAMVVNDTDFQALHPALYVDDPFNYPSANYIE